MTGWKASSDHRAKAEATSASLDTTVPEENFHANDHPESHVTEYFNDCFQGKLATDDMAVSLKSFPTNSEILLCQDPAVWHVMRAPAMPRESVMTAHIIYIQRHPAIPLTLLKLLVVSTDP